MDAGKLVRSYTRAVGSERASTTRQRERGQICYRCGVLLTPLPPWTAGERACDGCEPRPHRVLMNFAYRGGWIVHFVANDCRTPISRFYKMPDLEALRRLASAGRVEDSRGMENAIEAWGRGSQFLRLTEEQYRRLRR